MTSETKPPLTWSLDEVDGPSMTVWAEMLRDDNQIHLDPDTAAALGFGRRTVNQGPANLAYILNMLLESGRGDDILEVNAQFLGTVLAGDAVAATGEMDADAPDICRAQLTIAPDDRPVVTASIALKPERK